MRKNLLMAALLVSLAISGACDATGAPVAGGNAYFTAPGSASVSVTAWANKDATAALPNPVPLDAAGRAAVFLDQPADVRVEDSSGATVATYPSTGGTAARLEVLNAGFTGTDPVSGAQVPGGRTYLGTILSSLYASFGGTDGNFLAAPTGTKRSVKSKFTELQISVKDFGAVGNGIADDTTACQAAIDYVAGAGGGVVYFPPATYLTSAALRVNANGIVVVGAGSTVSIIKGTNGAQNGFTVASGNSVTFRNIKITHSSTSTGYGISLATGNTSSVIDTVTSSGFAAGVYGGAAMVINATLSNTDASTVGALSLVGGGGRGIVIGGQFTGGAAGSGIMVSDGVSSTSVTIIGSVTAGTVDVDVLSTAQGTFMTGVVFNGAGTGLRIAATVIDPVVYRDCYFGLAAIVDNRATLPVSYSLAADGAVTPLPLRAEAIRIVATAAATVTINAVAKTGFGRKFSLTCARTTASAVTWTFNAQYVLSAAVAPANGNRVNLLLEYDPIDDKVYEIGRAATAN